MQARWLRLPRLKARSLIVIGITSIPSERGLHFAKDWIDEALVDPEQPSPPQPRSFLQAQL
jgi:hypothetical protein